METLANEQLCTLAQAGNRQAGSIGLWRAIDGYSLSEETKFLTYAAPAIKRAMSDLIRQYNRDTVWQLRHSKSNAWKIVYLDEDLDDVGEDTIESPDSTKFPFGTKTESRAGRMTWAMELLREWCGNKLILGCGVPVMPAFGLVDYCRVSCDVGLDWDDVVVYAPVPPGTGVHQTGHRQHNLPPPAQR